MKCTKCGNDISPNQSFCSVCGSPVERQNQSYGGNNGNGGKSGVPIWLTIVLILLIVAIMLVIMFVLLNNKDDSKSDDKKEVAKNNVVELNETNDVSQSNTSTNTISQNNSATSYYKVKLGNYQLKVPDNLIYEVEGEYLGLMDEDETWVAKMAIMEGSMSSLTTSNVASYFRSVGATVNNTKETTIGGLNAIVVEMTYSGINEICAYVRINSMYLAYVQIVTSDYVTYNYDALNTIAKILATVQVVENESSTSVNLSTDNFSKFYDYLKNQNN